MSQADVTDSMPSQFHNDDEVVEVDKLITGVDSFIVDDVTPSSEVETDEAEEVRTDKKRTRKKRLDKTIDIDSEELDDLKEMNTSLLKSRRSAKIYTATPSGGSKVKQTGRRIFMMADSSDEENVQPPVRQFVNEISSDEGEVVAKPDLPDHSNDNTNDNTYDYNDSFIDDKDSSDSDSPTTGTSRGKKDITANREEFVEVSSDDGDAKSKPASADRKSDDQAEDDSDLPSLSDNESSHADKACTSGSEDVVALDSPPVPKVKKTTKKHAETPKIVPKTPKSRSATQKQPMKMFKGRTMTFLESLSLAKNGEEEIDFNRCHPDASKYLKSFSRHKTDLAKVLYDLYNRDAFEGQLPSEMEMIWCPRLTKTAGTCILKGKKSAKGWTDRSCKIKLSVKVLDSADRLRDTLVHEMCHAAAWLVSEFRGGHGPVWKGWAGRAMKRLPELPIISRCHSYEIRTKYKYVCTGCGHTYGRHSKSIDTEGKCCGKCRGKLVLQGSRGTGNGAGSAPPKTPNAFARFVKEKYKHCRTPGSTHADAMKQISAMFAQSKMPEQSTHADAMKQLNGMFAQAKISK